MKSLINHFRAESQSTLPDISHFQPTGAALGSNPGGPHVDPYTHQKYYVKFYSDPEQAKSEVAAAKIYEHVGAKTLNPTLATHNGRTAVVTKWRDDVKPLKREDYNNLSDDQKHDLARHFHAAILTKNWDSVGMGWDNLGQDAEGKLHTIDTGGTFNFRAQGAHKDFGPDIAEKKSLRDPAVNSYSAFSFSKLGPEHHTSAINHVQGLTDSDTDNATANLPAHIARNIKGRRDALLKDHLG